MLQRRLLPFAAAALFALAGAVPAAAQSADQIVRALMPSAVPSDAASGPRFAKPGKSRSFGFGKERGISISGRPEPAPERPSINLTINFEFDSARLTNDGWIALQALGEALSDPRLGGMRFEIAGHTDGRGTPDYNLDLSERRAQTVARHLELYYAVDPSRLSPIGYGESRLIDPANPERDINRRVEVTNMIEMF